jgi:UDP-glucose 4-epimerase
MASKPIVPGPEALFHFWPLPRRSERAETADGSHMMAPPDGTHGERPVALAMHPDVAADDAYGISHKPAPAERLLITGIAGGQGRLIARRVANLFDVSGVDRVPWEGHPRHLRIHLLDLRKKKLEDIFRSERPTAVVHLAFVRHFDLAPHVRHEVNVLGTKQLLEYCAAYGVRQLVVLSSAYVYGALPENPCYMTEDAALNVSRNYPEIRDLAEVDTLCSAFLWRYPQIKTSILRPVNTLGYYVHSAVGRYLKLDYVPTILGFDPMTQFIHEEDVAEAIALALEMGTHGVFNVTGPGAVPLKVAIRETGGTPVPIPERLARIVFGNLFRLGLYPFPSGTINFVKYPCTVDGSPFRNATGFTPLFTLRDIFSSVRH